MNWHSEELLAICMTKKIKEYKEKQQDLVIQIEEHTKADEDFYLMAPKLLGLASRALEISESSEVNEKRALLDFLLQNPTLNGRKLVFKLKKTLRYYGSIWQNSNLAPFEGLHLSHVTLDLS